MNNQYKIYLTLISVFSLVACAKDNTDESNNNPDNNDILPSIIVNGIKTYVHPSDNSSYIQWGGYGTNITSGNGANSYDYGEANTSAIVSQLGSNVGVNYAAKVCDELIAYGYSDWYLPSKNELELIYNYKSNIGGFVSETYFSSTELGDTYVFSMNFNVGLSDNVYKNDFAACRCIRQDNKNYKNLIDINTSQIKYSNK